MRSSTLLRPPLCPCPLRLLPPQVPLLHPHYRYRPPPCCCTGGCRFTSSLFVVLASSTTTLSLTPATLASSTTSAQITPSPSPAPPHQRCATSFSAATFVHLGRSGKLAERPSSPIIVGKLPERPLLEQCNSIVWLSSRPSSVDHGHCKSIQCLQSIAFSSRNNPKSSHAVESHHSH